MVREPAPPAPKRPPACEQGPALRKLIAAVERDGRRKPKKAAEGRALIEAGKALCIAKCGGCELTRAPTMPRMDCRREVRRRLGALAAKQSFHVNTDAEAAQIAAACRDCARCPKFAASISFMLLGPPGPASPR